MNTRTYPRTAAEAFKGCDYACALERPAPPRPYPRALWWVLLAGLIAAMVS